MSSVFLRASIGYDLAPIFWIRLNEMKDDDDDVLFHFNIVCEAQLDGDRGL